jgi:hypothetical protein
MKVVRLSGLSTSYLYPKLIFLVLISMRVWIDLNTIVRSEGLCQWKNPVTPSGIELATFRLVAHRINQLLNRVLLFGSLWILIFLFFQNKRDEFWQNKVAFLHENVSLISSQFSEGSRLLASSAICRRSQMYSCPCAFHERKWESDYVLSGPSTLHWMRWAVSHALADLPRWKCI